MGNLPKERLGLEEHPFTYTGVDFFGPFNVKYTRGTRSTKTTIKRYGVLFTCLTIRAFRNYWRPQYRQIYFSVKAIYCSQRQTKDYDE